MKIIVKTSGDCFNKELPLENYCNLLTRSNTKNKRLRYLLPLIAVFIGNVLHFQQTGIFY